MRTYLLLGIGLALASCAAQKALPQYTEAEQAAQRGGISYWQPDPTPADSTPLLHRPPVWSPKDSLLWAQHKQAHQVDSVVVERTPTFLDKVLRRTPKPYTVALTPARIGKKSTVNVYLGPANVTTAGKNAQILGAGASNTQTGKKSGDIIKADSGSIVSKVAGPGNTQTTRGNNNTPTLTAPVQQAADWRATLAKYAGPVLAGAGTIVIVGGCIFLIAAYKRRNLLNNNG